MASPLGSICACAVFVFVRFVVVSVPSHILLLSYLQLPPPLFCFFILLLSVQYVLAEYVVWSGEFWWALVPGGADANVDDDWIVFGGLVVFEYIFVESEYSVRSY